MLNAPVSETVAAFEAQAEMQFLERPSHRLHYASWRLADHAPGEPLLVYLHGFKNNLHSFADLMPRLDRPAVALDLQGHGRSSMPDASYIGLADYAADLHRLLTHLGAEKVILVGHSLGSRVGAVWASIFPERAVKLVMIDGYYQWYAPVGWPDRMKRFLSELDQPDKPRVRADAGRLEAFLRRQTSDLPLELARHLAQHSLETLPDGETVVDWSPFLGRVTPLPFDDRHMREALLRLTVPTLVLQADPTTEGGIEFELHNPHIRIERVPGSHQLHWHRPLEVAAHIHAFLTGHAHS